MRAFLLLVKLRLTDVFRRPISGFFVLILPVLLLLLVGGIFANGHPFERRRLSWVDVGPPGEAASVKEALGRLPGTRLVPERSEAAARGALLGRMSDAVLIAGHGGPTRLLVRPNDEVLGRGLVAALEAGQSPDARVGDGQNTIRVDLEIVPSPRWGYLHYLVPGMLALSVMLTGLYGMGYSMVRFRATRFLKKLSTTPLSKSVFVGSQITGRAAIVLAQMALMVLCARLVFGLPLTLEGFFVLLALTVLGLFTFMSVGFALSCVIRSEGHIQDVINAITGPLVLLSEVFFSADELPGPLPQLAGALPSTQLVRLSRAVLLQGETHWDALLPGVLVMSAWLIGTFVVSRAMFRWND